MVLVSLLISSEKKIVYETLAQQIETRVEVVSVMDWGWIRLCGFSWEQQLVLRWNK